MQDNVLEINPLAVESQRNNDASFDWLACAEQFEDISAAMIIQFRDNRVIEEYRGIFDRAEPDEKIVLVATDTLSDEEFSRLKNMAVRGDAVLPGIHNVRNVFHRLYFLTGDGKYSLNGQNQDNLTAA